MVKLSIDDKKANDFYENVISKITERINDSKLLNTVQKEKLLASIKEIIVAKPQDLLIENNKFRDKYFPNLSNTDFVSYIKSNKKERSEGKYSCIHKEYIEVQRIFDYKKSVSGSYFLAKLLAVDTCVYCNRNYVKTIGSTTDKVCRAEYDHWYNKSDYPLLALSFYNLVPSCPFCNKLKSDKKFNLSDHFHPYTLRNTDVFTFTYLKKDLIDNNVVICNQEKLDEKNTNLIDIFKIDKLYDAHSGTELKELLDLRFKYSKNYIDDLINVHFKGVLSEQEIYRMIFGIEKEPKDFSKRPMSKFKNDIIEELMKKEQL